MATSTPVNAAVSTSEFRRLLVAVRDSPSLNEQSNAVVVTTGIALENLRAGAIRRAMRPEERKLRSERAKAQHAAGNLGRQTWQETSEASFSKKMKQAFKDGKMKKFEDARASWGYI